jgi:hypothetical protein
MNVEKRKTYGLLVEKAEGKRTLGRARHKWVHNINMGLRGMGWGGMDCTGQADNMHKFGAP